MRCKNRVKSQTTKRKIMKKGLYGFADVAFSIERAPFYCSLIRCNGACVVVRNYALCFRLRANSAAKSVARNEDASATWGQKTFTLFLCCKRRALSLRAIIQSGLIYNILYKAQQTTKTPWQRNSQSAVGLISLK